VTQALNETKAANSARAKSGKGGSRMAIAITMPTMASNNAMELIALISSKEPAKIDKSGGP